MVRTASPVRDAHLSPPRLSCPKHRPIVENGTFSTGPFVRNRREPRPGRPSEAPPTPAICQRGVRGPARRMETLPAPGSLWFLSPAGKELARPQTCETPSSRIFLLPVCLLFPHLTLRQYRTNSFVRYCLNSLLVDLSEFLQKIQRFPQGKTMRSLWNSRKESVQLL